MTDWIPQRPEYYVQTGSMFENPHGVPHDEIVRMILENPPEVTAQTVFGKYVESSGLVFTGELIQQMIDRTLPRVLGNAWIRPGAREQARAYHAQSNGWWGNRYHSGVDLARQTDYTVIFTIDTQPLEFGRPAELVYFKRLNRLPWEAIYAEIGKARMLFGTNILVDSTGMGGDVVMDALGGRHYCPEHHRTNEIGQGCTDHDGERLYCRMEDYISLGCIDGFNFSPTTKKQLIDHLRVVLSSNYDGGNPDKTFGLLRVPPIVQLEEEMTFYAWDDKNLMTDTLFALALAVWSGIEEAVLAPVFGSPFGR